MMTRFLRVFLLIPAVLLVLGGIASADSESGEFEYRILKDGSAEITGYKGSGAELVFPETIDGYTVSVLGKDFDVNTRSVKDLRYISVPNTMTVIEPGALRLAEYLTEIRIAGDHPSLSFADGVLYNTEKQSILLWLQGNKAEHFDVPDGIREIEDQAFVRAGLVSVSLPGSTERIGCESFSQCYRLTEISLSEGLKTIDTDAFINSDKLRYIGIPASVTDIAESAFTDCHLKKFSVSPDNAVFTVSDGALINIRDGVLIAYPQYAEAESCVIPEGVTRIGAFAFYRSHNLKQVVFPEGMLEIGRGAFFSCNHLTSLDLPDSVILLEDSAFGENSDAERLHIPAGLTEIVNNFIDLSISELEIPESVTTIRGSFCSLRNLTEVNLPDSVETVSHGAFAFCKNLACITVPASVTDFRCTFAGCSEALVIRVEPGSSAEQYCLEHQLNYGYIPE